MMRATSRCAFTIDHQKFYTKASAQLRFAHAGENARHGALDFRMSRQPDEDADGDRNGCSRETVLLFGKNESSRADYRGFTNRSETHAPTQDHQIIPHRTGQLPFEEQEPFTV